MCTCQHLSMYISSPFSKISQKIVQFLVRLEIQFLAQAIACRVDRIGSDAELLGNLLRPHSDADVGAQAKVILRQVGVDLLEPGEKARTKLQKALFGTTSVAIVGNAALDQRAHRFLLQHIAQFAVLGLMLLAFTIVVRKQIQISLWY